MREIKFRAWEEINKVMHFDFRFIKSGNDGNDWLIFTSDKQTLKDSHHPFDNPCFQQQFKVMQYTGLKDANGVEIYEGDLLNIYFTSSNGEHIHDCVYRAVLGALGDIQFEFVNLLWIDNGYNQYPSSTTLCQRYGSLDYEYKDQVIALKVPDSWHENLFHKKKWKGIDKSFYFKVIGNIHQNTELLK